MLSLHKLILPVASAVILAGCTLPGSHIPLEEKNVVDTAQNTQVEQVNVYPLSHSFIANYGEKSINGQAQINHELDAQMALYEYKVGPGDVLNITVWDHPELTIPAGSNRSAESSGNWVHGDGKIFYPYIGFVEVAGKNVVEIREELTALLSKYVEDPQVDVKIAAFRSQKSYVTGEINAPGQQAITNVPLTLLDAINNAGGLTATADWRNVTLTRDGQVQKLSLYELMQNGDLSQNRLIQKGDIIHVPSNDSQKIFVLGDVKSPTMLKIDRLGMSLTEALSTVGGINELAADATGVFVIRSSERDAKNSPYLQKIRENKQSANAAARSPENIVANIYQLDISDASALVIGTEFELEPYDIVYVTSSPIERYNRLIKQLLPTISGISAIKSGAVSVTSW
jgi:polysaccharide export outer membrane protein